MIQFTLLVFLVFAVIFSMICNRDIFSPAKFYYLSLSIYFLDIFLSDQNKYIYSIYFTYILIGMLASLFENKLLSKSNSKLIKPNLPSKLPPRFFLTLWCISLLPIISQIYLIHIMGGLDSYGGIISLRVQKWRGLGVLLLLIKFFPVVNLVYFAVGLTYKKKHEKIWWLFYLFHLTIFVFLALLSGSRGFLLFHFVFLLVIYHYLKTRVKIKHVIITGLVLFLIASFLGGTRGQLAKQGILEAALDKPWTKLNLRTFEYGIEGLNIVYSREYTEYKYGTTFFAGITNFVPRKIWPAKFEPGGVVLTKFDRGSRYTGTTNLSPGIITENILNFGYSLGIISGMLMLTLAMILNLCFYAYFINHIGKFRGLRLVFLLVFYPSIAGVTGHLLYGEFCHIVSGIIIMTVLLSTIIVLLSFRITKYSNKCSLPHAPHTLS